MSFIIASGARYRENSQKNGRALLCRPHVLIEFLGRRLSNVAFLRSKKTAAQRRAALMEHLQRQDSHHADSRSVAATGRRIARAID
jgi:hypothetical protein